MGQHNTGWDSQPNRFPDRHQADEVRPASLCGNNNCNLVFEMNENIALFDLDEVLADFRKAMRSSLNDLESPEEPQYSEHCNPDHPKWHTARLRLIKSQPGFWRNLPEIPRGFEILKAAVEVGFRIHILTASHCQAPNAWAEKVEWCREHVRPHAPDMQVTVTQDKGLVYGKVLVDDYPGHIQRWLRWRPRGLVVMPAHPDNFGFSHPQVVRYDGSDQMSQRENYQHLLSLFRRAITRR